MTRIKPSAVSLASLVTLASLWLVGVAPARAANVPYPITIGVTVDGNGCIQPDANGDPDIDIRPTTLYILGDDHPQFFSGAANASDAPVVRWTVETSTGVATQYEWIIKRKADTQRLFFKDLDLPAAKLHTADNEGRKVDKIGPPYGIRWRYSVAARWPDSLPKPSNCLSTAKIDPEIKFKRTETTNLIVELSPLLLTLLVVGLLVYAFLSRRRRVDPIAPG